MAEVAMYCHQMKIGESLCNATEKMIETITTNIFFSKFKANKEKCVDNTHMHHGMYLTRPISVAAFASQLSADYRLHYPEG